LVTRGFFFSNFTGDEICGALRKSESISHAAHEQHLTQTTTVLYVFVCLTVSCL